MREMATRNRWLAGAALVLLAAVSAYAFHHIGGFRTARSVDPRGIVTLGVLCLGGWCLLKARQSPNAWALAVLVVIVVSTRNATALLGTIVFVLSCLSVGQVAGKRLRWPEGGSGDEAEEFCWLRIALLFFLGLGVNAYAIWVAMHFRVNYPFVYFVFFGGEILLARKWLWSLGAHLRKQCGPGAQSSGQTVILLWTLVYVPYTLVPFYLWDDLGVHLYIPKVVSLFGQFSYTSKYPVGFDHSIVPKSAYTALYLLGGEIAVRLFNFLLFPAAFWVLEQFSRRRWGRDVAFWSTLTALGTPFFLLQFGTVFIDSFALFSGTVLLLYTFHLAENFSGRNVLMYFAVGVLAFLSKQMAIYLLVPTGVWVCWLLLKDLRATRTFTRLGYALAGSAVFILALLPLVIASQRALGYSGLFFLDPVLQRLFHLPHVDGFTPDGRWAYPFSWRLPFDLTFNGLKFTEIGKFSFGLSYFVFGMFLPLVFLKRKLRKDALVLALVFAGAGAIWVSLNGAYLRYFAGMVPVGSVLLGMTLTELFTLFRPSRLLLRGGQVCVGLVFCSNFGLQLAFEGAVRPYPLLTALTDDHRRSSSRYMLEEARIFRFAGVKYGRDVKCLLLSSRPVLYLADFSIEGAPYYNQLSTTIFRKASTAEELFTLIFLKERFDLIIARMPSGEALLDSPEFLALVSRDWEWGGNSLFTPRPEALRRLRSP